MLEPAQAGGGVGVDNTVGREAGYACMTPSRETGLRGYPFINLFFLCQARFQFLLAPSNGKIRVCPNSKDSSPNEFNFGKIFTMLLPPKINYLLLIRPDIILVAVTIC